MQEKNTCILEKKNYQKKKKKNKVIQYKSTN